MDRLKSLAVALVLAAATLIAVSATHHLGNARAAARAAHVQHVGH